MKIDYLAWAVMFIALAGLFWNVNTGFNLVHERIDRLQAETNRRFDQSHGENNRRFEAMQTEINQMRTEMIQMRAEMNRRFDAMQEEMNRRFDAMQTEMNRRFDAMQTEMNRRFDITQTENQRQHDAMEEVLRVFEGRITRLEEKADIGPKTPSNQAAPLVPATQIPAAFADSSPVIRLPFAA